MLTDTPEKGKQRGQNIGVFGRWLTGRIVHTGSVPFHVLPHRTAYQRALFYCRISLRGEVFQVLVRCCSLYLVYLDKGGQQLTGLKLKDLLEPGNNAVDA